MNNGFNNDISVQFNSCTMLIVEEMSTIIVQCANKDKYYFNFYINNLKL